MSTDFEAQWQRKLSNSIQQHTDDITPQTVLAGGEALSDQTPRLEIIAWSQNAMGNLLDLVEEENGQEIMSACACHAPDEQLLKLQTLYARTHDLDEVFDVMRKDHEIFLRENIQLNKEEMQAMREKEWGQPGKFDNHTITVTKIPKSGYLKEYLAAPDAQGKREVYCHCPRVRDAIKLGETIPAVYCYCGAGFYKHMWETILQVPVSVEVLESVLQGGDVCTMAVYLPEHV